jgi:release factor glutamine methyltransferase
LAPELVERLQEAGVETPGRDLQRLYDWAYEQGQGQGAQMRETPNAVTMAAFDRAVAARVQRQPVSQITGLRDFWRYSFRVTPDVLDPRPETEALVEAALTIPFDRVLDLGTGSGCILLSLLADRPTATGVGADLSDAALQIAQENAERLGVSDRAELIQSDWFAAITGRFDLIVSNPPYIAKAEMAGLAPEVREWEPQMALTDGADGLTHYRSIATRSGKFLRRGGVLMVETGYQQGPDVASIFTDAGFVDVAVLPDLGGADRVVRGKLP